MKYFFIISTLIHNRHTPKIRFMKNTPYFVEKQSRAKFFKKSQVQFSNFYKLL